MKRSEINRIMLDCCSFLQRMRFSLPPFAFWTPAVWRRKGNDCREVVEHQLGWDITDFGSGDFASVGLFLFTIRNGSLKARGALAGKTYAEKIMIVREQQVTPIHFHSYKMEDIINRGGGVLIMRLWNATNRNTLANTKVTVSRDGQRIHVPAGGIVKLRPGESISLPPRLYHSFWGASGKGTVLVGEVSKVNDDHIDNHFLEPVGRFPAIQEDEPPIHLLVGDYRRYYRG